MAVTEEIKKSKRKKEMNLYQYYERLLLINSDNYLLSIDEASKLLRIARSKFVSDYVKTGKIKVTLLENNNIKIRNADLRNYLDQQQRIYRS